MKKRIQDTFRYFQNDVIGVDNRVMAYFYLAAIAGVVGMSFLLSSSAMTFQGVAGSRESNINFEYPVEIRRVHVLAGQRVKKGDLLLELSQSGLNTQIRQVTAALGKLKSERTVRDQLNRAVGNRISALAIDPLSTEIRETEEELAVLERQRKNLFVFSETDGIVGSVNFKRGERAPSFASLVTLSSESPTFVQAFIHERAHADLRIGSRVSVASLANPGLEVKGRVVSVGSRIVEMPVRLGNPAFSLPWGREVVVQIPQESRLLLGERVQISPSISLLSGFLAHADELISTQEASSARSVTVPSVISERMNFEPSGLVYLPDVKKFLVASDDTDNENSAVLFLMSPEGEVSEQVLRIPGVKELVDMESLSVDGEYTYVMTSLSAKKKGEPKAERNLLVRFKRRGLELRDVQTVNLGVALRSTLARSTDPVLQELSREGFERLESEAHAVRDGSLLVALKRPALVDGGSVILKIPGLEELFTKGQIAAVESWKVLHLRAKDELHQISDMVIRADGLYLLTTCHGDNCGGLWKAEDGKEPKLLRHFSGLNPEGLAFAGEDSTEAVVTFDQGEEPAKFSVINLGASSKE